ncbi:polysaccharide biosynthesis C-terminal domain-containing protein [Carnobacterium antarcticum]|uniref:NAD-dependent epimerase/dehydratase family protein n=1 Tax=Carnobacterium antarcticum TaxID=2126436 RepID=A0ABW4NMX7_9LACT|nr:NAD-dependent epimerase/dehydratase family protein [Carnobacterium sp. CP1]ALV21541.1 Capsular polysaccharide synthesis enzyme Cap5F [Carnobacterium sp. CP1]
MKILVTGAKGFIGKNLVAELNNLGYEDIFQFNRDTDWDLLDKYTNECDFVFHLAGVNRPRKEEEFMEGNANFTSQLLELLKKNNNKAPILITSSIQAEQDNHYGKSKRVGEELVSNHEQQTGAKVYVYRLPNVFGKWSKPNYNTVVATYCYNIARNMDIQVNDPNAQLILCYIDDVIKEFTSVLSKQVVRENKFHRISKEYYITLGNLAETIKSFKESRNDLMVPDMENELIKKLYSTYLSFLPENEFSYNLKMNIDQRGSFTEFIKTPNRGQVSINVSKPNITKGNHWHHTKNEKFLVVSGKGQIRFRNIDSDEIIEYNVTGEKLEVVDIPTGYTHSIVNIGETDLVTVMWANELFDKDNPDTYYVEV